MLGFLRGIERGVEREGAARRAHYGTLLSSKNNHLDRLLSQIRYNQQQKRQRDRDTRQDFVTDRAHDRSVLESDRSYKLRQDAATRDAERHEWAGDAHRFNYDPETGYMHQRRKQEGERHEWAGDAHRFNYGPNGYMQERREREGDIHRFNYGDGDTPGYMQERREREGDIHNFNYDPDDGMQVLRRNLFKSELDEYIANADVRELQRAYTEKLLGYNTNEGFDEMRETTSLQQDLIRAQIGAYGRRGTTTTPGGQKPYTPTFSQAGDITADSIAPIILQYLEAEGEHVVAPWDFGKAQYWPPGFQADRPWTSTDPNELTQTNLLRRAGAELVKELTLHRGLSRQNAMQMIPELWDEFLTTKNGAKILKRLERTAKADGYDPFKLREEMRKIIYNGAMNYMQFGASERPAGVETPDADKILDMELP